MRHVKIEVILLGIWASLFCVSCTQEDPVVSRILNFQQSGFQEIVDNPRFEFQMIYTEIQRDSHEIILTSHTHQLDTNFYFYPASTVKMPVAFLALQRLKELGLDKNLDMKTDSIRPPQSPAYLDSTTTSGYPNVARYIEKLFVVSDNDAYNRLYEFLGQDYINDQLRKKKIFSNSRIRTRVGIGGFNTTDNRYTNPIAFYQNDSLVYQQKEQIAEQADFLNLNDTQKGVAYFEDDKKIEGAFDMSQKNFINLRDLEASLMRIVVPQYFLADRRFDLSDEDYNFLRSAMAKTPSHYPVLNFDPDHYYDSYAKFFIFGDKKTAIPDHIKIHNKVGYAYGYLTDVAYVIDYKNNVEFFLTATLLVNENQTFNDNKYEYEEIGIPFLAQLGRNVYEYELSKIK